MSKRHRSTAKDYYPAIPRIEAPDPEIADLDILTKWLEQSPDGMLPGQVAVHEFLNTDTHKLPKVLPSIKEQRPTEYL